MPHPFLFGQGRRLSGRTPFARLESCCSAQLRSPTVRLPVVGGPCRGSTCLAGLSTSPLGHGGGPHWLAGGRVLVQWGDSRGNDASLLCLGAFTWQFCGAVRWEGQSNALISLPVCNACSQGSLKPRFSLPGPQSTRGALLQVSRRRNGAVKGQMIRNRSSEIQLPVSLAHVSIQILNVVKTSSGKLS